MRLVLDTNVTVSALRFPQRSLSWIRTSWQSGVILPLRSDYTTTELVRVLSYPKLSLTVEEQTDLLDDYLPWCEMITVPELLSVPNCRDPRDHPFLELALAGNADSLVTSDNDILPLAPEFSVPIITPRELNEQLASST